MQELSLPNAVHGAPIAGYRELALQLVIEAALESGYRLRVEYPSASGGTETNLVQPALVVADGTSRVPAAPRVLVARGAQDRQERRFELDRIVSAAIDTGQLAVERIAQDGFAVGDPVVHAHFGFGIVQAVWASGTGNLGTIRFPGGMTRSFVLRRAELEKAALVG